MFQRNEDKKQKCFHGRAIISLTLCAAMLLWTLPASAQAPNGTLPEGATVTALGRTALVRSDGSFVITNVPANIGRFRVRLVHPDGRTAETDGLTPINRGTTIVPPLFFRALTPLPASLTVTSPLNTFTATGQTAQLTVTGNLQGGGTADLTNDFLTSYSSSNASFATVSSSGLVTLNRLPLVPATLVITILSEGVVGTFSFLLNPGPATTDLDNDGMPNDYELRNGFDPTNPADAGQDADNDGLTNLREFQSNTEPRDGDTDRDGISDGSLDPDGAGRIIAGPDPEPLRPETIPPACALTSPAAGATVVEGDTINVRAAATDNVGVSRILFTSNAGGLNFADLTAPYETPFVIPAGVSQVTFGALSTDIAGNSTACSPLTVNVIPDPLTTVNGRVVDENLAPLSGVSVSVLGRPGTTLADGTFSISNVPTTQGNLVVTATFTAPDGTTLTGASVPTTPAPGGTTNVGDIVLTACNFETALGTNLGVCDDCFFGPLTLPFNFPYYGVNRGNLFVTNNGLITFSSGTGSFTESFGEFQNFNGGMIAVFWDDLDSRSAQPDSGLYVNLNLPGRVVVTWLRQREFGGGGSNTLQAQLFPDGRVIFLWRGVTARDAIVGISPGPNAQGTPPLRQVNFSATPSLTEPTRTAIGEQFFNISNNPFDLDGGCVTFTPNGAGYDARTVLPPPPPPTATVSGTVFDAGGQPLSGVEVELTSTRQPSLRAVTVTDDRGRYAFTEAPAGGMLMIEATQRGIKVGQAIGETPAAQTGMTLDVHPEPVRSTKKSQRNTR